LDHRTYLPRPAGAARRGGGSVRRESGHRNHRHVRLQPERGIAGRTTNGWRAETIFEDLDKGHWLATAELDGRNATREIITSGYSGRMVLLARPPGFGRAELAVQTAATESFETTAAGALPGGWTSTITGEGTPAWSVVACDDAPSGTNTLQQSGWTPKPSYPLCLAPAELKDGFVEVKFKALSGTNDQAGGVVWRARDAMRPFPTRAGPACGPRRTA
jgi:hypothetical protein